MSGDLLNSYQHLPQYLNPNISVGFFSVSWYSIMYLVALGVVYGLVRYRINKREYYRELKTQSSKLKTAAQNSKLLNNLLLDFLLYSFLGLLIGARLGEVFFYNFSYYAADPLLIISPFDLVTGKFIGIYGMSYHGGLIGVAVAGVIFCRKFKINFWQWANFIVPAVPLGYFFGRLGNFINGELYGRVTDKWWGMYFPGDPMYKLRHPSQLYEAFLEGIILFAILWPIRNHKIFRNYTLAIYLAGYAIVRIIAEFYREPDGFIGPLTIGQFLSAFLLVASIIVFLISRKGDIIEERKKQKNS